MREKYHRVPRRIRAPGAAGEAGPAGARPASRAPHSVRCSGSWLVVVVTNGFSPTVAGTLFAATSTFLILESVALLGTGHRAGTGAARGTSPPVAPRTSRGRWSSGRPGGSGCPWLPPPRSMPSAPSTLAPYLVGPEAPADAATCCGRSPWSSPVAALSDLVLAGTRGGLDAVQRCWSRTSAGSASRPWPCWWPTCPAPGPWCSPSPGRCRTWVPSRCLTGSGCGAWSRADRRL